MSTVINFKQKPSTFSGSDASALLQASLELAPFGVCILCPNGIPIFANRQLLSWVSPEVEKVYTQPIAELIHHADRAIFACAIRRVLAGKKSYRDIDVRLRAKNERWVMVNVSPIVYEGKIHAIIQMTDISRRKKTESNMAQLARRDHLTGLANRMAFEESLRRAVKNSQRHHRAGAVLYVDLDDFKSVNDNFGHKVGDLILQRVSKVLEQTFRETDTTARIGGDEFAVIMEDADEQKVARKITQLQTAISSIRVSVNDKQILAQASIGCRPFTGGADTCMDTILADADRAMYNHKSRPKSTSRQLNA